MVYEKGLRSREEIVSAASRIVLERGYAASSFADIAGGLGMTMGKITHHFPSKSALFEAIFDQAVERFRTETLPLLSDPDLAPAERLAVVFERLEKFYLHQGEPIGCPVGHTAMDPVTTSAAMRSKALSLVNAMEALMASNLVEMGWPDGEAERRAALATAAWQGAVMLSRAGGGLAYFHTMLAHIRGFLVEAPGSR
jgi:AcrR family transcriptional regulator